MTSRDKWAVIDLKPQALPRLGLAFLKLTACRLLEERLDRARSCAAKAGDSPDFWPFFGEITVTFALTFHR